MEFVSTLGITDITIVAVIMTICVVYALWRDTGLLVSTALALPIAGFMYALFPYTESITALLPLGTTGASLLLFTLFVLLTLWIFQRTTGIASGSERPLHIVITATSLTTLLIGFAYHVVPIETLHDFGPTFDSLFASATHFFWIAAVALLALFIL